jgi:hypothetical protein
MIHKTRELLADDTTGLGPVLYYQISFIDHVKDGHHYQSTSWRTIPAYQGGEEALSLVVRRTLLIVDQAFYSMVESTTRR